MKMSVLSSKKRRDMRRDLVFMRAMITPIREGRKEKGTGPASILRSAARLRENLFLCGYFSC
jgi:hypothetical protein